MEHKTRTKALSWLLSFALMLSLIPGMSLTAYADGSVTYLDADGNTQTCTEYNEVTNENGLQSGWNVVKSGTVSIGKQRISGDVNLILCDNTRLTVNGGTSNALYTYGGGSLTIYAQSTGNSMGELVASSNNNYTINTDNGNITINGGKVTATASGSDSTCRAVAAWGNVTINGGIINATGYDSGIYASYGNNVEINGGTVTAQATDWRAIDGTVKNKIAGVGWTDASGSGDGTTIAVSETGQTLTYKKVQLEAPSHTHDFTYSLNAAGDTITATCNTDGCPLPPSSEGGNDHVATLTIAAPTTGNDATITVSPAGALTGYTVKYQTKSGENWSSETETAPSTAGIHKASITLTGTDSQAATASVSYGNNCITYATELTHGSISGDTGATCGATVTPNITPDEGYELDALTVTPEEGSGVSASDITVNGGTFVMPEANVTVSATFKKINRAITVTQPTTGGTVTAKIGNDSVTSADYGDTITLGNTQADGYSFTSYSVTKTGDSSTTVLVSNGTFAMPEYPVTVTGTFSLVDYTVTAADTIEHGTVTPDKTSGIHIGDVVTLTVNPAEGYEIDTLTVTKEGGGDVTVTNNKFTMPAAKVTVSATFKKINSAITIVQPTIGGSFAVNNGSTALSSGDSAAYGDNITLSNTPATGFSFVSYKVTKTGDENTTLDANSGSFSMPAYPVTVSATFEGEPFDITTEVSPANGGTVSVTGDGVTTSDGTKAKAGSTVTLTVEAYTGFNLGSVTVKNANGDPVDVTDNKFTMPTKAVSVSATFAGHNTTATLDVTGNSGPTCTAKLLDANYKEIDSVTKKGGEEFILCINKDEAHSYKVSFSSGSPVSMRGFSVDEYKTYINSTKSESLNTYLYWVTMPGVDAGSVNMTVTFATAKTFTILYQPKEGSSPDEVWVKFGYTESGQDKLVTAKMSPDAKMGNAAVWSLKMSAAFDPTKIAFDSSNSALENATLNTISQTNTWVDLAGNQYNIVCGEAKTVIAAFTDDSSSANANRDATEISIGNNATYQIAICASGGSGSVTTPAKPTRSGYVFVAWRGYEGITAKDYAANTPINVKENMAFSAVWKPSTPNVKLNLNGGTGIDNTEFTVTYDTTLPSLTPAKSGYSFAGWSVAKDVTEDGKLYTRGAPFDTGTKITADLELTAQWKHVHAYGYVQIGAVPSLAAKYEKYAPYLHIKICGCGDVDLEVHSLDSSGRCVCGYKYDATPTPATLDVSYVRQSDNHIMMAELPETVAADSEVSVSAPGKWGNLTFSKWQYKAEGDTDWTDAAAYKMMSFVIPGNMEMRALYVNATTVPEVSMSATTYATTAANMDGELNSILFQMNYKLPDGYTYVDAGVRSGDNAGISYYELKERGFSMDGETKAIAYSSAAVLTVLQGGYLTTFDTSITEQYYAKRENSVLEESGMTAEKLGEYMYQSKPINIKDPPLYWNYKPTVTGQSGSINALTPVGFAQRNDCNHYIYAIAYLTYKKPNGTVETIWTDAMATTLNGISSAGTVSKSGS